MDHAKKGADALSASDFPEAIKHYTLAIAASPTSPDYCIKRSTAYQRSSPPDFVSALADAENAVFLAQQRAKRELIIQAQLRRAIALFGLERYADARFVFDIVKKMDPKEKTLAIWDNKIGTKLAALSPGDEKAQVKVKEMPELEAPTSPQESKKPGIEASAPTSFPSGDATTQPAAPAMTQTPANKIRHDWYQNSETVTFTLLAKGVPKDEAIIDIQERSLSISFPLVTGSTYDFSLEPLYASIDTSKSTSKILGTKIEIVLKKAQPGIKWHSLESKDPVDTTIPTEPSKPHIPASVLQSAPASYPTSSRFGPKDWDKLANDLTKKKDKAAAKTSDDKTTGSATTAASANNDNDDDDYDYDREDGDEANAFFKKLYAGASPDVRRAMMKSYTESNGTALSTNWDEVKKAKVETSPPDGMQARSWNE